MSTEKINQASVLAALVCRHLGQKNGVSARQLVAELIGGQGVEISERKLRDVITELRLQGHQICATPEHGYFMAVNSEELNHTCAFLHERAMSSLEQICAMKRLALPDLRGQLELPT